jgi:aminoglycoside phosphotransferase (APT) family kinase protein
VGSGKISDIKTGYKYAVMDKKSLSEEDKASVLSRLETLPDSGKLLHGDFHPQNIIISQGKPCVIDWTGAVSGSPMADVCGTYLIIKTAPTHKPRPKAYRKLMASVLDSLLKAYLKRYFKQSGCNYDDMAAWLPVQAAKYMEVGLSEECEEIFRGIIRGDGLRL